MSEKRTLLKNSLVIAETSESIQDILIEGEVIADIKPEIPEATADEVLDCTGLVALPGAVDAHSHICEPSSVEYREDFLTGTMAAAAGGITTILEMPLSEPPVETVEQLLHRKSLAEKKSVIDFGFWAALNVNSLPHLRALKAAGCIGFKAFMCYANPAYAWADDLTLLRGMEIVAEIGGIIGVHAENNAIVSGLEKEMRLKGITDPVAHEAARPIISETEAIERAIFFASETDCALHICHISTTQSKESFSDATLNFLSLSTETCPHYLILSVDDLRRCGGHAKCNPPLRSNSNRDEMWEMLLNGGFDMIGSDHSPYTAEDRDVHGDNIWDMPPGIGSSQLFLPLLISEGYHSKGLPLQQLARLTSGHPARRFGLYGKKGAIKSGFDADIVLIDLNQRWVFNAQNAFMKAKCAKGPYENRMLTGAVVQTFVRGQSVYKCGKIEAKPGYGKYIVPQMANQ